MKALHHPYNAAQVVLLLYAFVLPFQRLFSLPVVKYKFQFPELVFLMLCIIFPLFYKPKLRITTSTIAVLLLSAWWLLSIGLHVSTPSILEGMGMLYLLLVGIITALIVSASSKEFLLHLLSAFICGVVINCLFSFVGLFMLLLGIHNRFGFLYLDYPIIGSVFRMQGFTSHPIMLCSLAICALILTQIVFEKYRRIISLILVLGILLTFTKAAVSGLAAVLLIYHDKLSLTRKFPMTLILVSVISLIVIKEYLTHFTLPLTESQAEKPEVSEYWGGDRNILLTDTYSIYNTIYYQLKQASIEAFLENPITGVGGGNSNHYHVKKINAGELPVTIKNYDPHSTLFGILAEYGIIGFLLFILSAVSLFRITGFLCKHGTSGIPQALMTIFVFILFESISADILNYRHLWLLGGITYGIYALRKRNESNIQDTI